MLVISLVMIFIAGFFEGVMDILQFHFHSSIFSLMPNRYYWDPVISWRNKYQDNDPLLGPRFPLSTTFLVGLTDAWHTFKLLRNVLLFSALPIIGYVADSVTLLFIYAIIGRTVYGAGFWLAYYKVLRK